ncbi:hypothetical protein [Thermogemmatispora onikobensis]|uniref:hypothetical protein n=1 Tax=Thermogemmatispora onikobensis TaxID=732234 RepID=UPI000853468D|nr:hypothetical protein [Thermogemmatispora onikobensis]
MLSSLVINGLLMLVGMAFASASGALCCAIGWLVAWPCSCRALGASCPLPREGESATRSSLAVGSLTSTPTAGLAEGAGV